jgi:hypothetical protein
VERIARFIAGTPTKEGEKMFQKRPFAKGQPRRVPGSMNRLEADYHAHLTERQRLGELVWLKYEGMTFKLGQDCRYTPDFAVMLPCGTIELHETKGFMQDDALVKIKTCAEEFPFRLVLVTRQAKKDGGAWMFRVFGDAP